MKVYIVIQDDTLEGGAVAMVTTARDKAVKMCATGSSLVWEEHDLDAPLFVDDVTCAVDDLAAAINVTQKTQ